MCTDTLASLGREQESIMSCIIARVVKRELSHVETSLSKLGFVPGLPQGVLTILLLL